MSLTFKLRVGTCKEQSELTTPQSQECTQADWGQDKPVGDIYPEPNVLNLIEEDEGAGKEGILAHGAHASPFSKRPKNPSPTDLPARKKHNAVPFQLLNADPLAQIIGTETVADVIIDDDEACALLDSWAMADLMSSAYAEAKVSM